MINLKEITHEVIEIRKNLEISNKLKRAELDLKIVELKQQNNNTIPNIDEVITKIQQYLEES